MTVIPVYRPYVSRRCKSCSGKTDHVLIETNLRSEEEKREEIFECQACGEIKRIYEFTASNAYGSRQPETAKKVEKNKRKSVSKRRQGLLLPADTLRNSQEGETEKNNAFFLNSSLN